MAMGNRMQRDFTKGSIPKHLLLFSLPMFLGNFLQVMYNTVDTIIVGRFLGPEALGAVSTSFPIIFALLSLIIGITMATATMVAQYRGARQEEMVRKTVSTSMILLGVSGFAVSLIGVLFRHELLALVQAPEELRAQAATYFGIFMGGIMAMFLFNTLSSILRGLGDSKTPVRFMAIATIANIVLDYVLIVGVGPIPSLGIAGAAWATVIAQLAASVALFHHMVKTTDLVSFDLGFWKFDKELAKKVMNIGLPTGLQQVLVSFGMLVISVIINSFGKDIVAAFGAAQRFDNLAWMPAMTMGFAVTALVGQNLGAEQYDRVKSIVRWSCLLAAVITGMVGALAILNPTILMRLFTDDPQVLSIGSDYLQVMGWTYVPMALLFVLAGVMRGAGDTMPAMVMTVVALWGVRVPLCYWLADRYGIQGVWWGIFIGALVAMLLHWVYYLSGRWMKSIVKKTPPFKVQGGPSVESAAAPE